MPVTRREPPLPVGLRRWLRAQQRRFHLQWPPAGTIRFGSLRRLTPVSSVFGFDRGTPIDRYYMERFLAQHRADIRGKVLEVGDDRYTLKFGGSQVASSDVLSFVNAPGVTIRGDLSKDDSLPSGRYDCIICVQTLQMIHEVSAAIGNLHRMLRPGGVLLATGSGISKTGRHEGVDAWAEQWRFTTYSMQRLFRTAFPEGEVTVERFGNVLAGAAFLYGLSAEELRPDELEYSDRDYEVLIAVRAVRKASHSAA